MALVVAAVAVGAQGIAGLLTHCLVVRRDASLVLGPCSMARLP